jgi:mono/diheme cytochrome c family protein
MKRLLRYLVRTILVLLLVVIVGVGTAWFLVQRRASRTWQVRTPAITVPTDAEAIARGKRLVRVIAPCADCHGEDLGGKVMTDDFAMGRLHAANLTRGRGGIGATYTDEDWLRAMLHGVRHDGRSVVFMPSHEFHMTKADVADIIAYLRSLPPVDRERPEPRIGPMAAVLSYVGMPLLPAELIDHETVSFAPEVVAETPIERGHQLALKSACNGCHKEDFTGGGGPPPGAANITPTGIGTWTDADFIRALREHVRPNGTKIDPAMPLAYGQMTDDELISIHAFLKTLPAKGEKSKRQM